MKKIVFTKAIAVLFFYSFSSSTNAVAQDSLQHSHRSTHYITLGAGSSYILPTNAFFTGSNGLGKHLTWGESVAIKYGFEFSPHSFWGKLYPGAYQGVGISYHRLGNRKELGNPVTLFLYQGATITPLPYHFAFGYEWRFGGAFGWHPYNKQSNPNNVIMGKGDSFYMSIGLHLKKQLSSNCFISVGAYATHFSNGNTAYPNSGLNMLEPQVSLLYKLGGSSSNEMLSRSTEAFRPKSRWSIDLTMYASTKVKGISDIRYLIPGKFGVVGINVNPLYSINRFLKMGASLDFQYDESQNLSAYIAGKDLHGTYKFYRQPFRECLFLGTSLRGEFVMPIYSINFGLGYAIFDENGNKNKMYEYLGLKASISRHFYLHIGYMLSEFKNPKNMMFGLGIRLGKI